MSSVRFQGIVFLPTEQQCDQFGQILQNIANKVLEVFNGCQNKSLSYEQKTKLIQHLWSVGTFFQLQFFFNNACRNGIARFS